MKKVALFLLFELLGLGFISALTTDTIGLSGTIGNTLSVQITVTAAATTLVLSTSQNSQCTCSLKKVY